MENDNINAFPIGYKETDQYGNPIYGNQGLTKREYLAGLAMQGMMANANHLYLNVGSKKIIVSSALEIADELLKQLGE